jgi:hypothetical protein
MMGGPYVDLRSQEGLNFLSKINQGFNSSKPIPMRGSQFSKNKMHGSRRIAFIFHPFRCLSWQNTARVSRCHAEKSLHTEVETKRSIEITDSQPDRNQWSCLPTYRSISISRNLIDQPKGKAWLHRKKSSEPLGSNSTTSRAIAAGQGIEDVARTGDTTPSTWIAGTLKCRQRPANCRESLLKAEWKVLY